MTGHLQIRMVRLWRLKRAALSYPRYRHGVPPKALSSMVHCGSASPGATSVNTMRTRVPMPSRSTSAFASAQHACLPRVAYRSLTDRRQPLKKPFEVIRRPIATALTSPSNFPPIPCPLVKRSRPNHTWIFWLKRTEAVRRFWQRPLVKCGHLGPRSPATDGVQLVSVGAGSDRPVVIVFLSS